MYRLSLIKHSIAIFLCITNFTANYCMLTQFKIEPIIYNHETDNIRDSVTKWIEEDDPASLAIIQKNNDIIKFKEATQEEKNGKCITYAINKITNGTAPLALYTNNTSNFNVEKFFEQTSNPQKNDLAIYTPHKKNRNITHFAIIITPQEFESKFGCHPKIVRHKIFAVPRNYGNAITYWTLKQEFIGSEGNKKLLKEIDEDVNTASKYKGIDRHTGTIDRLFAERQRLYAKQELCINMNGYILSIAFGVGFTMVLKSVLKGE